MLEAGTQKDKLSNKHIKALTDIWGDMGERSISRLSGFSMWPLIKPGNELVVDHSPVEIKTGEIVVFKYQGKLLAHRVVKRIKNNAGEVVYLTKGDFNPRVDNLRLTKATILGRVIHIKRGVIKIDCSSFLWRKLNYLIAVYSYAKASL